MADLVVGNASGFYGDRFRAWQEMLESGRLDVLTGDYLAELTMLILGRDRLADPDHGYAKTFLRQMEHALGVALDRGVKIVTNAGGLNPAGLGAALESLARRLHLPVRVARVEGDAVEVPGALVANAYLGAFGIAECLRAGADVVITGRITDASLVVGPAVAHFGWTRADLDELAGATVAGHVLECGAQATGGNYAFFTELPDGGARPGFPIAELSRDGACVITKHPGTGGAVTVETVTAQLLYEIAGPAYPGPDVVARFDTIRIRQQGPDRVAISGVRGEPAPPTVKVGVSSLGGYRNAMTFVLCGLDIDQKAALVRTQLEAAVGEDGLTWRLARTDRADAESTEEASALLTVLIKDADPSRAGRAFSQAAVELALASYPGCTLTGAPADARPYGVFRADYLPQSAVSHTAVLPDGRRIPIAPPETTSTPGNRATAAPAATAEPGATGTADGNTLAVDDRPTVRLPLGRIVGARSGDKGGDANLGVWARTDAGYAWLREFLTVARLRALLPECALSQVDRYELANLRALNFVVHGLLGDGVAGSTRFDPQAKALGELLRVRPVQVPDELVYPPDRPDEPPEKPAPEAGRGVPVMPEKPVP
jgi:Acyclic terpene utilisation family protein AtuA